jgi:hypothetical protein
MFDPLTYLNELQNINSVTAIEKDNYGMGGAVEALETKFVEITGKEKAILCPLEPWLTNWLFQYSVARIPSFCPGYQSCLS